MPNLLRFVYIEYQIFLKGITKSIYQTYKSRVATCFVLQKKLAAAAGHGGYLSAAHDSSSPAAKHSPPVKCKCSPWPEAVQVLAAGWRCALSTHFYPWCGLPFDRLAEV